MLKKITQCISKIFYIVLLLGMFVCTGIAQSGLCDNPIILPVAIHYQEVDEPYDRTCLEAIAQRQIDSLNKDFQGKNADIFLWEDIKSYFPSVKYGQACISFQLAKYNHPSGYNLQDEDLAITINTELETNPRDSGYSYDSNWGGYINIFVQLSGHNQAPTYSSNEENTFGHGDGDGIEVKHSAFGINVTEDDNLCGNVGPEAYVIHLGRTLTHEMGHFLGLEHTWHEDVNEDMTDEEKCTGDSDGISDTPLVKQSVDTDCPEDITDEDYNSACNQGEYQMYMNYMDYAGDECRYMFTEGQTDSMERHIANFLTHVIEKGKEVICLDEIVKTRDITSSMDKGQAASSITASNAISVGAEAIYHAGETVLLTKGFKVITDSKFRGYIADCENDFAARNGDVIQTSKKIISTTEVHLNTESPIQVYPNPNTGIFTLALKKEIGIFITEIYSFDGRRITFQQIEKANELLLDISEQLPGFYLVKIKTESGAVYTEKVIKF